MTIGGQVGAGWFPDPDGVHEWRWWDGDRWADTISDGGVVASDQLDNLDPSRHLPPVPASTRLPSKRVLRFEVITVLVVVVGPWTASALFDFVDDLVTGDRTRLLGVGIPHHVVLDVTLQSLLFLVLAMASVLLVAYVLSRSGESLPSIGLRATPVARNIGMALLLVLAMGAATAVAGLLVNALAGSRQATNTAGQSLLGAGYLPLGIVRAAEAAISEEIIVCGYLIHRLRQIGWSDRKALATSTGVRVSYHVYGGVGLMLGVAIVGLTFGRFYERTQRLGVLVLTHFLYDALLTTVVILS